MSRTRHKFHDSAASYLSLPNWSKAIGEGVPHLLTFNTVYAEMFPVQGGGKTEWRFGRGIEAMKCKLASFSLGVAIVVAASLPAAAGGDWAHSGSTKDYGAAVPVPAPMPIPVFKANFYVRADFGVGTEEEPNTDFSGLPYGTDRPAGRFGFLSSWEDNELGHYTSYGLGVGYHFGNGFRTDFTAETRSRFDIRHEGTTNYVNNGGNNVAVSVRDEVTVGGGVFMFNGYYDFKRAITQSITPYIGAGLGFAWNTFDRQHRTTEVETAAGTTTVRTDESYDDKVNTVSLAVSATAGAAYEIKHGMFLDVNYRYLYIDGSDTASLNILGETSTLSLGSSSIHQVRAGLRVDLH